MFRLPLEPAELPTRVQVAVQTMSGTFRCVPWCAVRGEGRDQGLEGGSITGSTEGMSDRPGKQEGPRWAPVPPTPGFGCTSGFRWFPSLEALAVGLPGQRQGLAPEQAQGFEVILKHVVGSHSLVTTRRQGTMSSLPGTPDPSLSATPRRGPSPSSALPWEFGEPLAPGR